VFDLHRTSLLHTQQGCLKSRFTTAFILPTQGLDTNSFWDSEVTDTWIY